METNCHIRRTPVILSTLHLTVKKRINIKNVFVFRCICSETRNSTQGIKLPKQLMTSSSSFFKSDTMAEYEIGFLGYVAIIYAILTYTNMTLTLFFEFLKTERQSSLLYEIRLLFGL
jgi:hypothetical protein